MAGFSARGVSGPRTRTAFNSKNSEDALFSGPDALLCGQEIPVLLDMDFGEQGTDFAQGFVDKRELGSDSPKHLFFLHPRNERAPKFKR